MSAHWRLAIRGAALMVALAFPVGVAIFYFYGTAHAGAFSYGVGTGIVSFTSTALTVSLLPASSTMYGVVVWGASFVVRYGFAVGALGIPAYLELWPVVAMLAGFAGVYMAENAVLLPGVMRVMSDRSAGGNIGVKRWSGG
jgi:hypothetical protein